MQGWLYTIYFRDAVFFRPSNFLFFPLPPPPPPPRACIVCVTTMRVNWWLSGQFWLRKSSSFKGALPAWTPTRALPLDPAGGSAPRPPDTFLLFWTVPVASLIFRKCWSRFYIMDASLCIAVRLQPCQVLQVFLVYFQIYSQSSLHGCTRSYLASFLFLINI